MRTETHGGVTIEYPDYLMYIGDDNLVTAYKSGVTVQLGVAVGATWNNNGVYYESDLGAVTINISQLLRAQATTGGVVDLTFYIGDKDATYSTTFSASFFLLDGRTCVDRYHGTGHIVFAPSDGDIELPILSDNGKVTAGEYVADNLNAGIYRLSAGNVQGDISEVVVSCADARQFGYINDPYASSETSYEVRIINCMPNDGVLLTWRDCDGCKRYIVGKIVSRSSNVEQNIFKTSAQNPQRRVARMQRNITIGIPQASRDMWLEDIAYSESVAMVNPLTGDEVAIVPNFNDININEKGYQDITLEFIAQI